MSAAATVAKAAPAAAAVPLLVVPPFDATWAIIIPLGLASAALARLATVIDEAEPWQRVRRDLIKSAMIAGGNTITAAIIIRAFDLDYLEGLGVAFGCGFGGVEALRTFWNRVSASWRWVRGHLADDAAIARQEEQKRLAKISLDRTRELEAKARKLDERIGS